MSDPDSGPYGPPAFMSDVDDNINLQVNQTLPGSVGGPIEAVKRAVVGALRTAVKRTDLRVDGREPYVDLEYPLEVEQYPGIWIQFTLTRFQRAGLGHEIMTSEVINGVTTWTPIQVFSFDGKVTMSIVALKNLDRDQLADAIITMTAFSRTPEVWVTQPSQDTQRYRSLMTALDENPYVSITPNFDSITSGGQGVEVGVPWQPDTLAYTDSYTFDLIGQTQVQFTHDGAYTLSRVDYVPTTADSLPDPLAPAPSPLGQGNPPNQTWRTL